MILVDSRIGSVDLVPHIRKVGVPCEVTTLEFGDAYCEGNGPKGKINIGIERKKLGDMLSCIEDARYSSHQRVGMMQMFDKSFLIIEGVWSPSFDGTLMEGRPRKNGPFWEPINYRSRRVAYSKLRRYLFSVSLSGVVVLYSGSPFQTAFDICEIFHYFSKPFASHTSMLDVQRLAIPALIESPSLCRKWASAITDVGVKFSMEAERIFGGSPIRLAKSEERDWLKIPRLSVKTAQRIIREINER